MDQTYRDRILGSIIGGAAGDALGYPVEFMTHGEITDIYGEPGITEYETDRAAGKALISDDTQMTLFTANGLLFRATRGELCGIAGSASMYVWVAYKDWQLTQTGDYPVVSDDYKGRSWLLDVPELFARRAPGNTCLTALRFKEMGTIEEPINMSKGCGGIMRVAPVGLWSTCAPLEEVIRDGAEIAAITHGHPLGFIPAGILAGIVNQAAFHAEGRTLKEIIKDTVAASSRFFRSYPEFGYQVDLIGTAASLASNDKTDFDNIRILGEGWVAEETLAIAVYCALRYENDFSSAIIAAVNHDGDSDSTGAVTGNILGAYLGFDAIEDKWKTKLEMYDVLLEMAEDLASGPRVSDYSVDSDPEWVRKYVYGRWKDELIKP